MAHENLKNDTYKMARQALTESGAVRILMEDSDPVELIGADPKQQDELRRIFIADYQRIIRVEPIADIWTVERVREYAKANYANGGDGITECYDDAQILQLLEDAKANGTDPKSYLDHEFHVFKEVSDDRDHKDMPPKTSKKTSGNKKDAQTPTSTDAPKTTKTPRKRILAAEMIAVGEIKLTPMQQVFIQHMNKFDFWDNGIDSALWSDIYCDHLADSGIMGRMTAGAMITTLREKGILATGHKTEKKSSPAFFQLTDFGKTIGAQLGLQ